MATNNASNNAPNPNVTAHSVLISEGSSPAVGVALGLGQTLYGQAGADPIAKTLTAIFWNDVSGTTQSAAVNNGYIISNAGQTTVTLPNTAAEGSVIAVAGKGAAGWVIQAGTGQTVHIGNQASTVAGTITSSNLYDCIELVCVTADTAWVARNFVGNLSYA